MTNISLSHILFLMFSLWIGLLLCMELWVIITVDLVI